MFVLVVCVDFVFDATTGFADIPTGKNYLSKPYPNPASATTSFYANILKGSRNSRIKFFNMLGAEVKDVPLTESKNTVRVNVSDLRPGVYFYSLYVNGKSGATGKIMIARE